MQFIKVKVKFFKMEIKVKFQFQLLTLLIKFKAIFRFKIKAPNNRFLVRLLKNQRLRCKHLRIKRR